MVSKLKRRIGRHREPTLALNASLVLRWRRLGLAGPRARSFSRLVVRVGDVARVAGAVK